jgi:hypothetical protein
MPIELVSGEREFQPTLGVKPLDEKFGNATTTPRPPLLNFPFCSTIPQLPLPASTLILPKKSWGICMIYKIYSFIRDDHWGSEVKPHPKS